MIQTIFNKSLFIQSIILAIGACSPYPDLTPLQSRDTTSTPRPAKKRSTKMDDSPSNKSVFRTKIIGESQVYLYSVELTWEYFQNENLKLYRIDSNFQSTYLGNFQSSDNFLDSRLKNSNTFTYELRDEANVNVASQSVEIPKDLLVNKIMDIPSDYQNYKRIFFTKNSVLQTLGKTISWDLLEIRGAKDAVLRSFSEAHSARQGHQGAKSGRLILNVDYFDSELLIEWRGQTGGQGLTGKANKKRGANGSDGIAGRDKQSFGRDIFEIAVCAKDATNGASGGKGPKGHPGGVGYLGGVTESIQINITEENRGSRLILNTLKAKGGIGGKGGAGGLGGYGGKGGAATYACAAGSGGAEGPRGNTGISGAPGIEGNFTGDLCLRIGTQFVQGSCSL